MQSNRLPGTYSDAKELINSVLERGSSVVFSKYRHEYSNACLVKHYYIEPPAEGLDNGQPNLDLRIDYVENKIVEGVCKPLERHKRLRVLSSTGDTHWDNKNIVLKVWNGDYPTTVAVDVESGHVYLVYLYFNQFRLEYFGSMDDEQLETFLYTVNDREPFSIFINPNTMFQYIAESEGTNALKRGVTITFNCSTPVVIYNRENF